MLFITLLLFREAAALEIQCVKGICWAKGTCGELKVVQDANLNKQLSESLVEAAIREVAGNTDATPMTQVLFTSAAESAIRDRCGRQIQMSADYSGMRNRCKGRSASERVSGHPSLSSDFVGTYSTQSQWFKDFQSCSVETVKEAIKNPSDAYMPQDKRRATAQRKEIWDANKKAIDRKLDPNNAAVKNYSPDINPQTNVETRQTFEQLRRFLSQDPSLVEKIDFDGFIDIRNSLTQCKFQLDSLIPILTKDQKSSTDLIYMQVKGSWSAT